MGGEDYGFVKFAGQRVELSNEVDDLCRIVLIAPETADLECGRVEFLRLPRGWFLLRRTQAMAAFALPAPYRTIGEVSRMKR